MEPMTIREIMDAVGGKLLGEFGDINRMGIRIKRFNLEREKVYATGTDAIHCCLIPLAGYYFFSVSPPFGLHGSGKIEPVKKSC